mmetsp:Transcript_11408/g.37741  ORF Transcript_11408/g.37741 Transcript_11408/m.37741 type:complete len:230 (+) Transcript_11408:219-908(+)
MLGTGRILLREGARAAVGGMSARGCGLTDLDLAPRPLPPERRLARGGKATSRSSSYAANTTSRNSTQQSQTASKSDFSVTSHQSEASSVRQSSTYSSGSARRSVRPNASKASALRSSSHCHSASGSSRDCVRLPVSTVTRAIPSAGGGASRAARPLPPSRKPTASSEGAPMRPSDTLWAQPRISREKKQYVKHPRMPSIIAIMVMERYIITPCVCADSSIFGGGGGGGR